MEESYSSGQTKKLRTFYRGTMSPIFLIKCKKCDKEVEIYLHNEREIKSYTCPKCGTKGLWEKLPTSPLLKRDGTYSYLEDLKK